jgi:radical SAM superfamily enzyme YgiQ (UPF0313 family)
MVMTDPQAAVSEPSPALVIAITEGGCVVPRYDGQPEIPLDLAGLTAIQAHLDVARPGAAETAPWSELAPRLAERGLMMAGRQGEIGAVTSADRAPDPTPGPTGEPDLRLDQELVLLTPLLLRCSAAGFQHLDHEGAVRAVLQPVEVMALAAYRSPTSMEEACAAHLALLGPAAISQADFHHLTTRLVTTGLVAPFDPDHPVHARRIQQVEKMRENIRRQALVLAEFDRLEAEHDASPRPVDAVRVIGFHNSWSLPPSSLGMLIASAKAYEGGVLEQSYDFRPRLLWDRSRFEAEAAGSPAIFLFSNYAWSSQLNLDHSALAKARNPHHVMIHGGPDTPKYPGDVDRYFAEHPHVDIAVHGEGEATFIELLRALSGGVGDGPPDLARLADVAGLSFRQGDGVVRTAPRDRIADLDTIPSPLLAGLFDGFIPAGGARDTGIILETNRGCPYGCTFCDWGSATLSRIRKFDVDRVFAELEWMAEHQFETAIIADANYGIFERDVDITQHLAHLKSTHGYPRYIGTNFAKNSTKNLAPIINILTDAAIVAEGQMSLQTFDDDTLLTIRRKNIKVEKYNDLAKEFHRNGLPLAVELMMGLPGATPDAFRTDLQSCIDRDLRGIVHVTILLPNGPMNEPEYRQEHGITASHGEEIRECATFTRQEWDQMYRLRAAYNLFETFAVLRQVATFVRAETGLREIDLYEQILNDAHAEPDRWPACAVTVQVVSGLMVPPVSWRWFSDEIRRYLIERVGIAPDSVLDTVMAVQHALLPARDRVFPVELELEHDYATWHAEIAELRAAGHRSDWPDLVTPLRQLGPAVFRVDDPHDSCQAHVGPSMALHYMINTWDLGSPVSRPRVAEPDIGAG